MNIIIFEDQFTKDLRPFTYNHGSFEVKTGMMSNLDRFIKALSDFNISIIVRDDIEELIKEKYPYLNVNPSVIPKGHCLNAKILWKEEYNKLYLNKGNYIKDTSLLICYNATDISIDDFYKKISKDIKGKSNHSIQMINYLWDAIDLFEDMLEHDLKTDKSINSLGKKSKSVFYINERNIRIGKNTIVKAGSILDAGEGPIIIGNNVVIDIGSKIQGPVFIEDNSYISPGSKIRSNCLIGKSCKVGGEVSNSIFHANSNKVHDGFIGHSYIGEWVNIGAGTNNSNLKNNYNTVKFQFDYKIIDSKRIFLGSMIGDFTRIGISSMLNTGTFIGIGANFFGSDFKNKYIKSFSWGQDDVVDLEKLLKTCSIMKDRKKQILSDAEKKLIIKLYNKK